MSGNDEYFKYSEIRVEGKTVTPEQAAIIIYQCQGLTPIYESFEHFKILYELPDSIQEPSTCPDYRAFDDILIKHTNNDIRGYEEYLREKYGFLNIDEQLFLEDRVVTNFYFGAKGWCNWDGKISCCRLNSNKYPSPEIISEELELIANRYPFLDARFQLMKTQFYEEEENVEVWQDYTLQKGVVTKNNGVLTPIQRGGEHEEVYNRVENGVYDYDYVKSTWVSPEMYRAARELAKEEVKKRMG